MYIRLEYCCLRAQRKCFRDDNILPCLSPSPSPSQASKQSVSFTTLSFSLPRLNRTHTQMSLIESMNRETKRKIDLYLGVINVVTSEKENRRNIRNMNRARSSSSSNIQSRSVDVRACVREDDKSIIALHFLCKIRNRTTRQNDYSSSSVQLDSMMQSSSLS